MLRVNVLLSCGFLVFLACMSSHLVQSVCNSAGAVNCGQQAAKDSVSSGCQYSTVVPVLTECIQKATGDCDQALQQQWIQNINIISASLVSQMCSTVCQDEAAVRDALAACDNSYGGVAVISAQILKDKPPTTGTLCGIVLMRIRGCMLNTTISCESLFNAALLTLNDNKQAFDYCGLTIPPLQRSDLDSTTEGSQAPSTDSSNLQVVMFVLIGLAGTLGLISGVTIMVIWMLGQRNKNFKHSEEDEKPNYDFRDQDSTSGSIRGYYDKDRSPRRQSVLMPRDDMGPYRPNSVRWWTRPGFGTYGNEMRIPRPF